jgi:hypothetical protein
MHLVASREEGRMSADIVEIIVSVFGALRPAA